MVRKIIRKSITFTIILICISVSFTSSVTILEKSTNLSSNGNILYVGGSGEGNYTSIQDAIDNTSDGDTVFVYTGTYIENLVINKSISLIGEDKNTTIIDGNYSGYVIYITANWVNITAFSIRGSGSNWFENAGVFVDIFSNNITIRNNIILNNEVGIYLFESDNNLITGNNLISNNRCGIKLYDCFDNNIIGNNIWNDKTYGISLTSSDRNIIYSNNISSNNYYGLYFYGDYNTITCNTISYNDYGIFFSGSFNKIAGNNISKNKYNGIFLDNSKKNSITGNNISNNYYGIYQGRSSKNTIIGNNLSNNDYGIFLCDSKNNTIAGNKIAQNIDVGVIFLNSTGNDIIDNKISLNQFDGIRIYKSNKNTINSNHISNNTQGLSIKHTSDNNNICHNNFLNNSQNAFDECYNTWNNVYPSCGNYWDDYNGNDDYSGSNQDIIGSDGIGDIPYDLPCEHVVDNYPLMKPYCMTKLTMFISKGLFKFIGTIKNIGNKTAFNVQWRITIDGGKFLLGRNSSGLIPKPLLPDEVVTINSKLVLGYGPVIITVELWADNAPYISEKIYGFLLFFFLMIH